MSLSFRWNRGKAATNLKKHGVDFEEAKTVFSDPLLITFHDLEHSIDEHRYITIGLSIMGRLLLIAHTDDEGVIGIISARKATIREQRFYEEEK